MGERIYEFEAVIEPVPDKGGAYVRFPFDLRKEFGRGPGVRYSQSGRGKLCAACRPTVKGTVDMPEVRAHI